MRLPIDRAHYRTLEPDWEGQVVIADIDRTYLATRFSSMRGMARIPFERAAEKRDIDGMARLFREIRRGPEGVSRDTPLFFVSASPKQLRRVIERKMALDGIMFDGTTFKDWGRVVRRIRLSRLREQLWFKLTALMVSRAYLPEGAQEILLGDDLENDPVTYALYADSLANRIPTSDLARILRMNGVLESDATTIVRTRTALRPGRGVLRAFIRLERHQQTDDFIEYAPGVVGCMGAFQMAVALWKVGAVSAAGIGRVASELVGRGIKADALALRLYDLCRRAIVTPEEAREVAARLRHHDLVPELGEFPEPDPRWSAALQRDPSRVWTPRQYLGE